jgi:hypothetical protein
VGNQPFAHSASQHHHLVGFAKSEPLQPFHGAKDERVFLPDSGVGIFVGQEAAKIEDEAAACENAGEERHCHRHMRPRMQHINLVAAG